MDISRSQQMAMEYITKYARNHKEQAKSQINHILKMSNISSQTFEEAIGILKDKARIGLHFHPDRPISNMKSVQNHCWNRVDIKVSLRHSFQMEVYPHTLVETVMFGRKRCLEEHIK